MNELFKSLMVQAINECAPDDADSGAKEKTLQRFAELIVGQCTEVATSISTLYPRQDVGFDVGYTIGAKRVATEINKHFGITE